MGNTTSDVNDRLKAQADSENGPELYKLVNVNEGGILTAMMKNALKNKDFTELDHFIKTEVVKFLYNDGQGEHVKKCHNNFKKFYKKNLLNRFFLKIPIEKIIRKKAGDKASKDGKLKLQFFSLN